MAKNEDTEKFIKEKFNIENIENENVSDKIDYEKLIIEYIRNRYFEAASEENVIIDLISYFEVEEKEAFFSIQSSIKGEKSLASFFKEEIEKLEDKGMIIRNKKGRIASSEVFGIYAGKISINAKGFGFLMRDNRELGDIFVPVKNLNEAMNNDRVLVKVKDQDSFGRAVRYSKVKEGNRQEGEVIRIIERANRFVTGTYHRNKNYGFVIPDDTKILNDIYISKYNSVDLKDNFKVVVEITRWPFEGNNPEGRIIEILGHKDDAGIDILSIAKNRGLPMEFPEEALKQAEKVPEQVSEDDIVSRRDLRGELIITIDGDDAKDLDDAVSLKRLSNGNYSLGVHIADVSQYVTENSPLDKEAVDRGTSVYMVDRVLPMLPPRLSNGICSLNPKVDRLTLSCNMEISPVGKVVNYEIFESVIKTAERMTYKNVNRIFDKEAEVLERYEQILDMLGEMKTLQEILNKRRTSRGSIEFEFPETKITLDEKGFPIDIRPYDRGLSERVIEEFMLVCNETVAEDMFWKELPFVYRVHETPDPERIKAFADFVHNFGLRFKITTEETQPKAVQEMMELVKGRREERLISTMMLRSLKKARYTAECLGHFGLAAKYYCHFTSPIRRYPDLIIHRIIKETLNGKMSEKRIKHYDSILGEIALHSSAMERRADEAEREVDDMKKAEFMSKHIGEEFDGIITSVQGFGFYVELPSTIEGLVHVNSLVDDYYQFDEVNHLLRGERRNLAFRIGDEVKVRVDKADVGSRKIDFSIVEKISSSVENTEMSEGEATNVSDKKIKSRRTAISGKEALRNVRDNKYAPEGRSYATRSRSSKVKDKVEKMAGAEPKREYVKSEGAKREEPKREYVKAEGAKKEGFKKDFVKSDAQKKDSKEISNRRNENMSYTSEKKPYVKDRDDKPKKMSFSEFADTEMKGVKNKATNYDSKNKTSNYDSKNKADAYDTKKRKSDEPYDGYFDEKGKSPEEYEKRVNRDKTSRSFKYGSDKPELLDEKSANKPTSYYMEKYGNLKPSKPGEKSGKSGPKAGGRPGGSSGYKAGGKFGLKPAGSNGGGKIKSSKGK